MLAKISEISAQREPRHKVVAELVQGNQATPQRLGANLGKERKDSKGTSFVKSSSRLYGS
jgi:hypothetical protein